VCETSDVRLTNRPKSRVRQRYRFHGPGAVVGEITSRTGTNASANACSNYPRRQVRPVVDDTSAMIRSNGPGAVAGVNDDFLTRSWRYRRGNSDPGRLSCLSHKGCLVIEGVVANRTGANANANACLNYSRERNQSLRLIVPQRLPDDSSAIPRRFFGDSFARRDHGNVAGETASELG
jgi:hypothetical protein